MLVSWFVRSNHGGAVSLAVLRRAMVGMMNFMMVVVLGMRSKEFETLDG